MTEDIIFIIEQAQKLGHTIEILSNVKSGKEATVYRVLLDGELVAMKVYKTQEERDFKNTAHYLVGKYYRRSSEQKAIAKKNAFSKKLTYDNWVKREYSLLEKMFSHGALVPRPILHINNTIFMELLGDKSSVAPRLHDVILTIEEAEDAYKDILSSIKIFWDCGIIHADLSEFNILWWKSKPYIIDFPQSIDRRTHPDAGIFLERDLKNTLKYFSKYIEVDFNAVISEFEEKNPIPDRIYR